MADKAWLDRLIHTLLQEELGGQHPPDLTKRVMARATRRGRWVGYAVAAAAALAAVLIGEWWFFGRYPAPRATGGYTVEGGEAVGRGATLHTAEASAAVVLGGYCQVEIEPESSVQIEGVRGDEQIELARGGVTCEVDRGVGRFAVRSEVGTVSVTGTKFSVQLVEGGAGMAGKQMLVRVLVGAVLVSGSWGQTALAAGEGRGFRREGERVVRRDGEGGERRREGDGGERRREGDGEAARPPREGEGAREPRTEGGGALPAGARGLRGYLIGNLVSAGKLGCRLEVASVRPATDGAKDPDALVGETVALHYAALVNREGEFAPSAELRERAVALRKRGGLVTAKVRQDDNALILEALWPGAQRNPERADPVRARGEGEGARERPREGDQPRPDGEGDRVREGDREQPPKGARPRRDGEGDRVREGDRERPREGDAPRRDRDGEGGEGRRDREGTDF